MTEDEFQTRITRRPTAPPSRENPQATYGIAAGLYPGSVVVDVPRQYQTELTDHITAWFNSRGIAHYRRTP